MEKRLNITYKELFKPFKIRCSSIDKIPTFEEFVEIYRR